MKRNHLCLIGVGTALLIATQARAARGSAEQWIWQTSADAELATQLAEVAVQEDWSTAAEELPMDIDEYDSAQPMLAAMEEEEPPRILPEHAAEGIVDVSGVASRGDLVTGTVVNRSAKTIRDVTLLVRRSFLWNDERNPGEDDPGRTITYTLPAPIPPHSNRDFAVDTHTVPGRTDGRFLTTVEVASFTEVSF